MILQQNFADQYLEDYRNNKINKGQGIGLIDFDEHLRFKKSQLNCINGLDNVGKTAWMLWYFLALAVRHGLRFDVYSGENKPEALVRFLIECLNEKKLSNLEPKTIYNSKAFILEHFNFIDHKGFYTLDELLSMFKKTNSDACLIDPYTGLNREFTHAANYEFLNTCRNFVNNEGRTLYFNTHPNTEAARATYSDNYGETLMGYHKPPSRSQSEGGQPFANRVDDFITIHRLVGHPEYNYQTHIYIRKVKDTETGGKVSPIDTPQVFEWNHGCGFTMNGQNPLNNSTKEETPF
jgi:hypothetical protein